MNDTVVVRARLVLELATVTVYEPVLPEHERFDVPLVAMLLTETLVGNRVHVRLEDGAIAATRETVPVNP